MAFLVFRLTADIGENPFIFWSVALIQMAIALLLLFLTQTFIVIRQRTLLPAFFYLLTVGTTPAHFYDLRGSVCALIIVVCLFLLFSTYQDKNVQGTAFNFSVLLTLGSLYWLPMLLFFPLFWYGLYHFRSLNWRTFFAGLMGFPVVYLFLLTWSVHTGDWDFFIDRLPDFKVLYPIHFPDFSPQEWLKLVFIIFLCILAGFRIFMSGISEKIRTMAMLSYLYVFAVVVCLFLFLQLAGKTEWALIVYVPISFLLAHYFTLSTQKSAGWLLFIVILFFLITGFIPG